MSKINVMPSCFQHPVSSSLVILRLTNILAQVLVFCQFSHRLSAEAEGNVAARAYFWDDSRVVRRDIHPSSQRNSQRRASVHAGTQDWTPGVNPPFWGGCAARSPFRKRGRAPAPSSAAGPEVAKSFGPSLALTSGQSPKMINYTSNAFFDECLDDFFGKFPEKGSRHLQNFGKNSGIWTHN